MVRTGLSYILVTKNIWPEMEGFHRAFSFDHVVEVTIGAIYVIAFVSAIKLTFEWMREKSKNDELQKVQLQTELNFLKTQIQPHFFFNTLNNLYSLVINKSPNAPDVVMKLSEIMQYVLYEAKEPKISLLKEIDYLYSYLELEKLRYGEKVISDISIEGNIDDLEITPLLFLPFIENCFKHGVKNSDNVKVEISFEIRRNFLYFTVQNTIKKNQLKSVKHGIGIENVNRRLQLLYGNRYILDTGVVDNNIFKVLLKLPINEN